MAILLHFGTPKSHSLYIFVWLHLIFCPEENFKKLNKENSYHFGMLIHHFGIEVYRVLESAFQTVNQQGVTLLENTRYDCRLLFMS